VTASTPAAAQGPYVLTGMQSRSCRGGKRFIGFRCFEPTPGSGTGGHRGSKVLRDLPRRARNGFPIGQTSHQKFAPGQLGHRSGVNFPAGLRAGAEFPPGQFPWWTEVSGRFFGPDPVQSFCDDYTAPAILAERTGPKSAEKLPEAERIHTATGNGALNRPARTAPLGDTSG